MSMRLSAPIDHDPSNERAADPPVEIQAPLDTMPAASFESSNVHSALYDMGKAELYVRYLRDGPDAIYQCWGVPPDTWDGLVDASSKGSYINHNIAYSFPYSKLSAGDFPAGGRGLDNDLARRFVATP
ncbi:KTSC domain-containing protein [Halobacteriales archaeon QS_1_68_20]|nr:MAG: KTSC domain-containing protein [Halobacteriales archaeon QS_1_68_20]